VLSKIDLIKFASLEEEKKKPIEELAKLHNAYLIQMSNSNGEGI
jgi:selenocysteine-specific translation elongation factor